MPAERLFLGCRSGCALKFLGALLQSIGILPADLTPDQISAFYTCFTGKVKEAYPQPATFAQDMCVDPGTTDIIIVMLQQCAQELQGTPAPAAKK